MRARLAVLTLLVLLLQPGGAGVAHEAEEPPVPMPGGPGHLGRLHCHDGLIQTSSLAFPCSEVDLLAWVPFSAFDTALFNFASDIWGWTDPETGREYAIMGLFDGAAFFDLGDPEHPVHLGTLPSAASASFWADIKVHADHAYIVKDEDGAHGIQVFDLTRLREISDPPVTFEEDFLYTGVGTVHNLVVNEETGFLYAVGSDTCGGGPHVLDLADPAHPVFAGCFPEPGWTHDAQCIVYRGPDADYQGREICFTAVPEGTDRFTIVDFTDKTSPFIVSELAYLDPPSLVGYAHQGWLSEDLHYFLMGDERDERARGHGTRTYVFDVSDLDAPFLVGFHEAATPSTDHNLYVRDGHVYQANYSAGLRILELGDLGALELEEVGFLDTYPPSDQAGTNFGPWSVYPFFESGIVVVSDILFGLFVVQPHVLEVVPVEIGLHPTVRPRKQRGVLKVVLYGSLGFAVEHVEAGSLALGPGRAAPMLSKANDLDRDGFVDLILHFSVAGAQIGPTDPEVCLTGRTEHGPRFEGCRAFETPPPKPPKPAKPTPGKP